MIITIAAFVAGAVVAVVSPKVFTFVKSKIVTPAQTEVAKVEAKVEAKV